MLKQTFEKQLFENVMKTELGDDWETVIEKTYNEMLEVIREKAREAMDRGEQCTVEIDLYNASANKQHFTFGSIVKKNKLQGYLIARAKAEEDITLYFTFKDGERLLTVNLPHVPVYLQL